MAKQELLEHTPKECINCGGKYVWTEFHGRICESCGLEELSIDDELYYHPDFQVWCENCGTETQEVRKGHYYCRNPGCLYMTYAEGFWSRLRRLSPAYNKNYYPKEHGLTMMDVNTFYVQALIDLQSIAEVLVDDIEGNKEDLGKIELCLDIHERKLNETVENFRAKLKHMREKLEELKALANSEGE